MFWQILQLPIFRVNGFGRVFGSPYVDLALGDDKG
jgi:hypothetical protein